jgi:ABC-type iron transport system FetAB ATPase subunit
MPFLIIIGTIIIGLIVRGVFLDKKKRLSLYNALLMDFGKKSVKKYKHGKTHRDAILKRFPSGNMIDDITWSDLDMEAVYERIDKCKSAVGEEYLYYLLRREHGGERAKDFDYLVDRFYEDEALRTDLLMSLSRLGYVKDLSPFDYLDHITSQKAVVPVKHILFDLLFIPGIAALFFKPLWGGIAIFAVIVLNILLYFRELKKLDGLVETIAFLVRLAREGIYLSSKQVKYLEKDNDKLSALQPLLKSIKTKGSYLALSGKTGSSTSGGPFEILLTYVNMVFHIDLIQYGLLFGKLSGQKENLEWLLLLFGSLDAAISVADFRKSLSDVWCKPRFIPYDRNDRKTVKLRLDNGYHPLVEKFVSNSIDTEKGVLLTGSNASGKSTFLRMVAINAILAQTIYTVCGKYYFAPVFDIYSSIALKDNLSGGESYFIVEIKSVKRILEADTVRHPVLCFIDEVLRGTNTVERISASETILKYFAERPILCFAATHDGELADMLADSYDNYHFSESIDNKDVIFDYALKKGKAVSRNAINLLKSYDYPEEITDNAEKMAHKLDS